ncbi:MAG TPA: DUF5819 family protein [Polyangiaceae bacterium]|jgi:hypothetical protein|nr:DUF5819 family protein [Polyangiaceae bacterium]
MKRKLICLLSAALRAVTLLGLALHFGATLLFVFPANPIKLQLGHIADMTIGVYFPQNWSLFAPNPVDSTQSLLLECLRPEELPTSSGAPLALAPDRWRDVSSAHFVRAHENPLSAYERMVRPLQNSLRRYVAGGTELAPLFQACSKGDQEACASAQAALLPQREQAARMIRQVASAFCRESDPGTHFGGVAVRYRERKALPWSQRHSPPAAAQDYQLGVFALDEDVALPGLYRGDS